MKLGLGITNELQIGYEILTYFIEHPDSRDTLEGIMQWWLLERSIKLQIAKVKKVLAELVARGYIVEQKGGDSQTHYQINKSKYREIQAILKKCC
ncbi:MAG: hypothetical protein JSU92_09440 [Deltaproteobacteria bacterium]|nr:MAG: hypothetical protein JSU92_09440 [Deltaproteobacteria bacterium]